MAATRRGRVGWVLAALLAGCATGGLGLQPGMTKQEASAASGLDFVHTRPNFRVSDPGAVYEEYFLCSSDLSGWYITMAPTCGRTLPAARITFLDGIVHAVEP